MSKVRRVRRLVGLPLLLLPFASIAQPASGHAGATWNDIGTASNGSAAKPLLKTRVDPREFGIQDETITVISGASFQDTFYGGFANSSIVSADLGRYSFEPNADHHYYATLDIPAGAVIDYVGLNTATDTDAIIGVALWQKFRYPQLPALLVGFSAPAHGWDTDFAAGLGIQVSDHLDNSLVFDVEQAPSPNYQYLGWVEVGWHRTVHPPPATATFLDVPPSHPFFQFIEAIHAAGITAGCGGGNFCPDQPITRKQEATFIAKALGLHWPN